MSSMTLTNYKNIMIISKYQATYIMVILKYRIEDEVREPIPMSHFSFAPHVEAIFKFSHIWTRGSYVNFFSAAAKHNLLWIFCEYRIFYTEKACSPDWCTISFREKLRELLKRRSTGCGSGGDCEDSSKFFEIRVAVFRQVWFIICLPRPSATVTFFQIFPRRNSSAHQQKLWNLWTTILTNIKTNNSAKHDVIQDRPIGVHSLNKQPY